MPVSKSARLFLMRLGRREWPASPAAAFDQSAVRMHTDLPVEAPLPHPTLHRTPGLLPPDDRPRTRDPYPHGKTCDG
jgi:hypothetical protein